MKKLILLLAVCFIPNLLFSQEMKTVDKVDLQKYKGKWYEVAKIPNKFQDQCIKNTTATYILEDDEIKVINQCIDEDGEIDSAEGLARVADTLSYSKLEVSFFSIFGWRPVWGDYWIIGLDEEYKWAIVGTPSRKYGWVLSRSPELPDETLDEIFGILKNKGYDISKFELSKQE